jgi:hypothetical protein
MGHIAARCPTKGGDDGRGRAEPKPEDLDKAMEDYWKEDESAKE